MGDGNGEGHGREWRVRRVLVALDASPASAAAARGAARLASALSAELAGLYVEDAAVARLAELPGAAEVGSHTGAARRLSGIDLRRRLRAQAARARRLLESSAAGVALEARLEVVRGSVAAEVTAAAGEEDLLSLGRVGTTALARLGSVARAALTGGRGPLLLLPPRGRLAPPLVLVQGDGAEARRALAAAVRLAGALGCSEMVVVLPRDRTTAWLGNEVVNRLLAAGITPRLHPVPAGGPHALLHACAAEGAGIVVLPAHGPLASGADVEAVLEVLDCAALVVR